MNYAILKHFTKVEEACAEDVVEALMGEYGKFKALSRNAVLEAIMTAEANGLLMEKRFEMDDSNRLRVYYYAHEEGMATINKYIRD